MGTEFQFLECMKYYQLQCNCKYVVIPKGMLAKLLDYSILQNKDLCTGWTINYTRHDSWYFTSNEIIPITPESSCIMIRSELETCDGIWVLNNNFGEVTEGEWNAMVQN